MCPQLYTILCTSITMLANLEVLLHCLLHLHCHSIVQFFKLQGCHWIYKICTKNFIFHPLWPHPPPPKNLWAVVGLKVGCGFSPLRVLAAWSDPYQCFFFFPFFPDQTNGCCIKTPNKVVTQNKNPCRNLWHPLLQLF